MAKPYPVRSLLIACSVFGAVVCAVNPGGARELAADIEDMVEVEIATIGVATYGRSPVVLLRQPEAREVIPIFIGTNEAQAILRGMHRIQTARPLTHELLCGVLDGLDVQLDRVYVDDLADNTYYGMLELRMAGREAPIRIDSRPSDALALALQFGATIHVAPKVLDAAREIEYEGLDDQIVTALGITVNPVTPELRDGLDLPDRPGVLVSETTGPASDAGMEAGALIIEVNGKTPESPRQYLDLVHETPADDDARIRYWQDGDIYEIDVPTDVPPPRRRGRPETPPDPGLSL